MCEILIIVKNQDINHTKTKLHVGFFVFVRLSYIHLQCLNTFVLEEKKAS